MAYTSSSVSYSDLQEPASSSATGTASSNACCSKASADLKLYQAFIFSIPIFFTFILLSLFYLFYLRRRRVDWSSIRMRSNHSTFYSSESDDTSRAELGLKKEVREMLPIIVFKESFSVKDTLCSVCLGEYQAEEKLQQIPACGHTFHMDCIDHWLSSHATCPLCRQSILVSTTKVPSEAPAPDIQSVSEEGALHPQNSEETSSENDPTHCEDYCRQHGGMSSQNLVERIPTIPEEEEEETTTQNARR